MRVCPIERFGEGEAAYCNKLAQLGVPELREADCAVLCDADLAFAGDIRPWLTPDAVRAKVVDGGNPPRELLDRLYAATGLAARPQIVATAFHPSETYQTNCNGGLYCVPTRWLDPLAEAWTKSGRFALAHGELLGQFRMHADQLGFCFAMLELGLPLDPLPEVAQFSHPLSPSSATRRFSPSSRWCSIITGTWTPAACCRRSDYAPVDAAIARVNETIRKRRHAGFDNRSFWDYRYASHPELGSGVGSRGDMLQHRRELLYPLVSRFSERKSSTSAAATWR